MKSVFTSFSSIFFCFSSFAIAQAAISNNASSCQAYDRTDESTFFSIVGVQGTGVQVRRELRDLEKDTEAWNIFLQAFARFQAMDQSDKVSYFQIAGIHGAPFGAWDGVQGDGQRGYCPHNSNLFGTWHRPYLALFEQVLHMRARDVANEYPAGAARDEALQIADKLRLPYWDWAMDPANSTEGVMPASLRRQTVTVTLPNGKSSTIANPLYQYSFHPLKYDYFSALSEFQFDRWPTTIRYPTDGYAENATSRDDEVNVKFGNEQPNHRDMLYKLLTMYQKWNTFSTKANGGTIGSLETLHDTIHNTFGLSNMGVVEMSAYDPVFWLHHNNIDRLLAIFQSRYPDTWVENATQVMATYTMAKDSTQGADSPLKPFHMNSMGDIWTSTTVRAWTAFGYTYPELASNPSNDTLTETINKLYKPQTQGLNNNGTSNTIPTFDGKNASDATAWLAQVHMPADIRISYSVRAFLGEPSSDPQKWVMDANYVGQIASLSSPRMHSGVQITASIGLTDKLAQKYRAGELKSLEKEVVEAYLNDNFHWRMQAVDGSEIPRSSPPAGLNVTVFNVPVQLPKNTTQVPEWTGTIEYKPDIQGNPPVDDHDTALNATLIGKTGAWNATSGTWTWNTTKSDPDLGLNPSPVPKPSIIPTPVSLSIAPSLLASLLSSAPASSVTPAPGEAVEVVTMADGRVLTKIVTVVVPVTIWEPAPTNS